MTSGCRRGKLTSGFQLPILKLLLKLSIFYSFFFRAVFTARLSEKDKKGKWFIRNNVRMEIKDEWTN